MERTSVGGEHDIARTFSAPLLVLPFCSPGDLMAPHIAEYNTRIQPDMRDAIS